ncbi:hypothetical protein BH24ACI3_BH24ACI3_06770 [soil metagenome]
MDLNLFQFNLSFRHLAVAGLMLLTLSVSAAAQAEPARTMPPDFKSDGCTLFPNGNYCDCCVEHDKDYYFGGTRKERWRSDKRLFKCVRSKKGWQNKLMAPIMLVGVRVGGVSFLPTPFRWGFGKTKRPKETPPAATKTSTSK